MSAVRGAASWLLICAFAACGDDEPSTTRPIDSLDGGTMDASAPPVDANFDARTQSDASTDSDGTVGDGGGVVTPVDLDGGPRCSTGSLGITTVSDTFLNPAEPLALSLRTDGASLGWVALEDAKNRSLVRWFGAGEAEFNLPGLDEPVDQSEPAIAATSTGFLSVSSDKVAGSSQLRLRRTNVVGELVGTEPTALTSDASDNHAAVLALGADGNVLVVWTARSPSAHGRSLVLSADGTVVGSAHDIAGFGATLGRAALSARGTGYLLAWVDATMRRVHVQALDASGVAVGGSTQVDADGYARGNLDLAFTDQGGALVFDILVDGVRPEVRVRTFNLAGVATGNERLVTPYPDTGTRPSLVAVRGGYMLAYRSAEAKTQQLRVALLDARGEHIRAANVAPLGAFDLPLVMRMSPDGEAVFLSWLDQLPDHNGNQLQRTWIHCD